MNDFSNHLLRRVSFADIQGWQSDDHAAALSAFQRSSTEIMTTAHGFKRSAMFGGQLEDWIEVCKKALLAKAPKEFFEQRFIPFSVTDPVKPQGLFTGYYEPEAEGSLMPTAEFLVPIYRKPLDLKALQNGDESQADLKYGRIENGKPTAYFTREEIEHGALSTKGLEIVWLKSWVDAFFIHVQGSGRIRLANGEIIRLAYAAKNGQPYIGIGGILLDRGVGTPQTMSMQLLRGWMKDHPTEARALMWNNKSYIFFRQINVSDANLGALGAQQVNLTPLRSLAVDRSIWMFGTPIWIDTKTPPEAPNGAETFRHLLIAQDTGTAIKGHVRGDVYWGWGDNAAICAGHMKSPGAMTVLLPTIVAKKLLLVP